MKKLLSVIIFFIGISFLSYATHNRAGEITYKWISGYTYKIIVTTYTNTINTTADRCELTVNFGDGDSAILPRINGGSALCPQTHDGVMIVPNKTKLNIYEGIHTYPGPGSYTITMEDPNRNAGICNIPNSVNASFFLTTQMVINPFLPPNSSPTLLNPPLDDACVGECFEHNPGAYDIDGDSLAYSIVPCFANGQPIPNYTLPPNFTTSSIDVLKGDIVWCVPTLVCQYNIAILIKEYKLLPGTNKRYFVGSILRDMQIDVAACNNNIPIIADVKDTCVIAGTLLNFQVTATDVNNNVLTLSGTGGPLVLTNSPATFPTVTAQSPVSSTFNWTPICDHIKLLPYLVTFKVTDNHPNNPLVNYESVFIRVTAPPPTSLTASPSGSSIILNWLASACSSTTGTNPLLGYKIYRKNSCDTINPNPCETGVPSYWGYTYIGKTAAGITTYTDNNSGQGLIHGINYSYLVIAYYSDGSESVASANKCVQLVRDVPIITNVSVQKTNTSNGEIWIKWVKPLGSIGNLDTIANPPPYEYKLLQAQGMTGTLSYSQIYSSPAVSAFYLLTDTADYKALNLNTQDFPYTYRIDFYSNNNLVGSTHTASSVYLKSTPADNKVNLMWSEMVPWTNYKYYIQKEITAGTFILLDSTISQNYTDTGLVNGANYCYRILSKGQYSDLALPRPLLNYSQIKCETPIDTVPPCQPNFDVIGDCILKQNIITLIIPNTNCASDIVQINIYFTPTVEKPMELIFSTTNLTTSSYIHINDYEGIPSIAGCYAVTAVDSFNNESIIIDTICVDNCPEYELPNVFTPNGDNNNDFFIPLPYKYVKDVDIKIYDRWGLLMFQTDNPDVKWDGTNKDTKLPCSDGTYYYVCRVNEIRVEGIKPRIIKGFVQLINNK